MRPRSLLVLAALSLLFALSSCSESPSAADSGLPVTDAGSSSDGGNSMPDAGQLPSDAGPPGTFDTSTWDNASWR